METHHENNSLTLDFNKRAALDMSKFNEELKLFSSEDVINTFNKINNFKHLFEQNWLADLNDLLTKRTEPTGKKFFLVYKHNKYFTVPTENIAFFYVRNESVMLFSYDAKEYAVNYSLEQIQRLLPQIQFFRLNRQYLVSFSAIKEVEHYFARKLFVKLSVATPEKLLVSKERSSQFLDWLENR